MSTLIVDKIDTEKSIDIRISKNKRSQVSAILPKLFIKNSPIGTFTLNVLLGVTSIFSQSFTSSDIKASLGTTDDNAYCFYPIIPENPLSIEDGVYTIKITSSGYTSSEQSYLGWVRDYEGENIGAEYTLASDRKNPLSLRIKLFNKD
jgi:hypothetical protein